MIVLESINRAENSNLDYLNICWSRQVRIILFYNLNKLFYFSFFVQSGKHLDSQKLRHNKHYARLLALEALFYGWVYLWVSHYLSHNVVVESKGKRYISSQNMSQAQVKLIEIISQGIRSRGCEMFVSDIADSMSKTICDLRHVCTVWARSRWVWSHNFITVIQELHPVFLML